MIKCIASLLSQKLDELDSPMKNMNTKGLTWIAKPVDINPRHQPCFTARTINN